MAGGRAQTKLGEYFFTIGFLINYTGIFIGNYMYHIIRLYFLVDCDLFSFFSLASLSCLDIMDPQHKAPASTPHTPRMLTRDNCPPMTFPMPALSPLATPRGVFLVGGA